MTKNFDGSAVNARRAKSNVEFHVRFFMPQSSQYPKHKCSVFFICNHLRAVSVLQKPEFLHAIASFSGSYAAGPATYGRQHHTPQN
jgi:hypothetical protein